ncbi:MAG TPA: TIGR00730 family Rossman fold protein [Blastocatellia bacterium]|nr:TIGR00730 family Rossman fold protein [Blastocatellia bacterium]
MNSEKGNLQSICVFCGSSDTVHAAYLTAARQMGRVAAERGLRLIFGGGRTGLMGAVADGALEAGGEVIGVIIPSMHTIPLAHIGLTRMDVTADMHARKARMHELADGYVALPGGFGTFDELFEALTWGQIGAHEKPIGLLNVRDYYAPLLAALDHAVEEGFIFREHRQALCCELEPEALLDAMANHQHPYEAVKRWMREE